MLLSPYAGGQLIAENIITPQLYGAVGDGIVNDLPAFQRAVNAAATSGGLLMVPNTVTGYRWAFSTSQYCLIVPSNITIWAPDSATIIPDVSTLPVAPAYPAAYGACIVSGNPTTKQRSGQTGSVVDGFISDILTQTVSNIHIKGLRFVCSNTVALTAQQELAGVQLWGSFDSSIEDCYAYNLPNEGFGMYGGARKRILNNTAMYCGWLAGGFARNGISSTGIMVTGDASLSSADMLIQGNFCLYNFGTGIETACTKGNIITDNVLVGNFQEGIEGDNGYATTHVAADYGQEIPNDCIISNNYIDGAGPLGNPITGHAAWTGCLIGISYLCGNQGRITITGNVVRNVTTNTAIQVSQNANGKIVCTNNYLEGCTPLINFNQFFLSGEYVTAKDNCIKSPGPSTDNQTGFAITATSVDLTDNYSDDGNTFFADISGVCTSVIVKGNQCRGTYFSFVRLNGGAGAGAINILDNHAASVDNSGNTTHAFLKFNNAAFTATSVRVLGNIGIAGNVAVRYPIAVGNIANAAIAELVVRENDFEGFALTTGADTVDIDAKATILIQYNNGIPGQRILWQRLPPTTGTWAVGDKVVRDFTDGNAANGRVATQYTCTSAGTPGTWRQCGHIVTSGVTGSRPTLTTSDVGIQYNDTTLAAAGKPIWWSGAAWVDATGTVV